MEVRVVGVVDLADPLVAYDVMLGDDTCGTPSHLDAHSDLERVF